MRAAVFFCIISLMGIVSASHPWPCFGGDAGHSRFAKVQVPDGAPSILWNYTKECPLYLYGVHLYEYETPVSDNGTVYSVQIVTDSEGTYPILHAHAGDASGTPLWRVSLRTKNVHTVVHSSPLILANGNVYVTDSTGRATVIDPRGRIVWQKTLCASPMVSTCTSDPGASMASAAAVEYTDRATGRSVIIQARAAHPRLVSEIDPATGAFLRNFSIPLDATHSPVVRYGARDLLIVSTVLSVHAFDLRSGASAWSVEKVAVRAPLALPPGRGTDRLLVDDFGLACFDSTTGRLLWRCEPREVGYSVRGDMALDDKGRVFIARNIAAHTPNGTKMTPTVLALDTETGEVLWKTALWGHIEMPLTAFRTASGHTRVLAPLGYMGVALDGATGKIAWKMQSGSYSTALAVGPRGNLFFCDAPHRMVSWGH